MNQKLLLAGLAVVTVASNVYAIPAFARQMNVSCSACHRDNGYPTLNRFGRDFKASGYTMIGAESTIDDNKPRGKFLSLPDTLNVSIIAEPSITKASDSDTNVNTSTIGMFLGGRIGEHMGTFVEVGYSEDSQSWGLGNLILPITYKVGNYTYGFVPFNTDGNGATASFELLSTADGAITAINAREHAAQGLGAYVYNKNFYVNYTAWANGNKSASDIKLASSLRAVYTPFIAGWDLAFGVQYMTGDVNAVDDNDKAIPATSLSTDAYAVDFQALGKLANLPVDFAASYGSATSETSGLGSAFTGLNSNDSTAFVVDLSVGIIPRELVVLANYAHTDNGTDTAGEDAKNNAEMFGLRYFLVQNVSAQTDITFNSSNQESDQAWGLSMLIAF